jgi:hypothetical protein
MPLVTLAVRKPKDALFKHAVLDPEHAMAVFKETAWENWAFAGGRILHA